MIFAYIDPGLGALAWQTAISACVGLLFYIKKTRRMIVRFFCRVFRRGQKPQNAAVEPPPAETETEIHVK
jgi:hypothetical protein